MISKDQVEFILASSSPRRKELLESIGLSFKIIKPDILEQQKNNETPIEYAKRNSKEKAFAVLHQLKNPSDNTVLISADTFVLFNENVLEKPTDKKNAVNMLKELSGNTHIVYSAVNVLHISQQKVNTYEHFEQTRVTFKTLSELEINWYVDTLEPMDKAGSYAIQGKGAFMIDRIDGNFSNVIGLPINDVVRILTDSCKINLWS